MEVASSRSTESDHKSRSSNSGDNEFVADNFGHLKVVAAAALAEITYDFGLLGVTKACVGSMENYARYFPKRYG
jgi:hypothetical protein